VGTLASISIDCPDPDALANFYRDLLGLEEAFATPDRGVICLAGAGPMVTLGAGEAEHQPAPDKWRVLVDPVGHPFCLSTVRPD
jgi:catechol 2,3-dioxygenase-like lactoylglutathione lyase family enzyme